MKSPLQIREFEPLKLKRDLLWILKSPSLLATSHEGLVHHELLTSLYKTAKWKLSDEHLLTKFHHNVSQIQTHKLGFYVEGLLKAWFWLDPNIKIIFTNKRVYREKKTLGELDFFIYFKEQQRYEHWETAIKFYLYSESENKFIGPGGKDRLDIKVKKMFDHQMKLCYEPEVLEELKSKSIDKFSTYCFLKGKLFYHINQKQKNTVEIPINPIHKKGFWLYHKELGDFLRDKHEGFWIICPSLFWISDFHDILHACDPLENEVLVKTVTELFKNGKKSCYLFYITKTETGRKLESHGFVVQDQWPYFN